MKDKINDELSALADLREKIKNQLLSRKRLTGVDEYVLACLFLLDKKDENGAVLLSDEHKEKLLALLKVKAREFRLADDLRRAKRAYETDGRRLSADTLDAMRETQRIVAKAEADVNAELEKRKPAPVAPPVDAAAPAAGGADADALGQRREQQAPPAGRLSQFEREIGQ